MIKYLFAVLFNLYCITGIGQSKVSELTPTNQTLDSAAIIYNTYTVNLEVSHILISKGSVTLFSTDSHVYKMFNVVHEYKTLPNWKTLICQDGSKFNVRYSPYGDVLMSVMYYGPDRKTIIRYL